MSERYFAVVPAAGAGRRMGAALPKQYLQLHGQTLLEHTLQRLDMLSRFEKICVALAADDEFFSRLSVPATVCRVEGGAERADSVLAALNALSGEAAPDDWVLVHDAARCCVMPADIEKLFALATHHPSGGILATPASDTIKWSRIHTTEIEKSLDRSRIWQAQTPQLFPFALLKDALQKALAEGFAVTDEASAMEWAGYSPLLVEGRRDNIKVTRPEDLALAAHVLQQQEQEQD